jgi:hypothetical protein
LHVGCYEWDLTIVLKLTSLEGEVQVKLQKLFFKLVVITVEVIRGSNLDAAGSACIVVVVAGRATRGSTGC